MTDMKSDALPESPRIEQRWTEDGEMSWCIIHGDKIIGFGEPDSKKLCEEVLSRDKESLNYYAHCPPYTLTAAPPVTDPPLGESPSTRNGEKRIRKMSDEGKFKVLAGYGDKRGGPKYIPWVEAEKFRAQAHTNHSQTLERLNERGGLSVLEIHCARLGKSLRDVGRFTWQDVRDAYVWVWQNAEPEAVNE
jgi:hypothetical protein